MRLAKKGLSLGGVKALAVGIILLVVVVAVYDQNSANFTGLTGTVMSFVTVGAAIGIFAMAFRG